tara:strand:+ start:1300 stop:1869 length:570 start_codon:yes stop_codon:yes gene_type:complete
MLEIESSLHDINDENVVIKDKNMPEKINKSEIIVSYLYQVFFHIFIFSIFESIFFWIYITNQEDSAIENQFDNILDVTDIICKDINYKFNFYPMYNILEKNRQNYNNNTSIRTTYMLNIYLLLLIILFNGIMKYLNMGVIKKNLELIKSHSFLFLLLFIYEYVFFKTIVYTYTPKSINKILKKFMNICF